MKKKLLTVALAAVMVVSSAFSAMAEQVATDTTFDGTKKADGSAAWASGGTGVTFPVTDEKVTVVFHNDAFTDSVAADANDKTGNPGDNWDNFILETIATDDAAGWTARADAFSWTYGDNTTNVPTTVATTSWDTVWDNFATLTDDTDVTLTVTKTDANTVEYYMTFASDASAWEKYVVTYPAGVPANLEFQVGADGGIVTLKSVTFGSSSTDTTTAGSGSTETTTAGGTTTTTPDTGDSTMVLALVAVAVAAAVVVLKKRTVTE